MPHRERVTFRLQLDPSARLRKLLLMRKIALTLAFIAIAAVLVMILVVMFYSQNT